MKKWERERQKEEARRRIGEPACAPPTSECFFILPSDFTVRCLTFANFVNFCSNFLFAPFCESCSLPLERLRWAKRDTSRTTKS
jgi:hypothetical protein